MKIRVFIDILKPVKNRYKCCTKDILHIFKNYIHSDKNIDDSDYVLTEYPQIQWLCRNKETIDTFLKKLESTKIYS